MRYTIYWENGDEETAPIDFETYAVLVWLEHQGQLTFFIDDGDCVNLNEHKNGSLNLEDMEARLIFKAMGEANGIQCKAAKLLGISERVIGYKLKKIRGDNHV